MNEVSIYSSQDYWSMATKVATSLAQSTMVPKDFQGNANNTMIAVDIANRLQVSPFMVMQNLYVVQGRPSWSAQYIIAMINGSGKYDIELQFEEVMDRQGKPFSCQCWTERRGRKVTGPVVDMDMANAEGWVSKNGSKWKTMPQMMLRYRAASFFGRMNCPDLTMGIYTREEIIEIAMDEGDIRDVEADAQQAIEQNANSVEFEELTVDEKTEKAGVVEPEGPADPF